mgnify:CR=1 FL=1|jgi:hypothetical protein
MRPACLLMFILFLSLPCLGDWVLSGKCLDVAIESKTGRIQVTDKRDGHVWVQGGEELKQGGVVGLKPVKWGDWASLIAEGNAFDLTPAMTSRDSVKVDDAADLSGKAYLGWSASGLMFQVDVQDDAFFPAAVDEQTWWEHDSVEFWLDGNQYAIRPTVGKSPVWHAEDVEAESERTASGYRVRVQFPLSCELGKSIRFAVGLNDRDGADTGRAGQLYYPTSWVHSRPESFVRLVLCGSDGVVVEKASDSDLIREFKLWDGDVVGASWKEHVHGSEMVRHVSCWIEGDDELHFSESLPSLFERGAPMSTSLLARRGFELRGPRAELMMADYSNGHLYGLNDPKQKRVNYECFGTLDIPAVGVIDGPAGRGYSLFVKDSDDATIRMMSYDSGTADYRRVPSLVWLPSVGKVFGKGSREYFFHFVTSGGYVALAKRWREAFKDMGYVVTLREKAKRNPDIRKLMGAADIWGSNGLAFAKEARAEGIEKLLVNGQIPAEAMEEVKKLGYLIGRYDNYTDVLQRKENEPVGSARGQIPEDCVQLENGERKTAWLTFDKKTQFMKRCPALWVPTARITIPRDLKTYPYNTRFIDVTTAESLYECYDPLHPLDRTAKRKCGEDLLKYVSSELGLVAGGEHGRWWCVPYLDYLEGMMSGGYTSWPAGHLIRPKTKDHNPWDEAHNYDMSDPETGFNRYMKYGLGAYHRAPIWELVFHDCIATTWYWGDSTDYLYQAAPETIERKVAFNVLYGTMPMYWIQTLWEKERDRFLATYFPASKMHETVGMHEMLKHEFLSDDRCIQTTTFADGTTAVVNLDDKPRSVDFQGRRYELAASGFIVSGPTLRMSRVVFGNGVKTTISADGFEYSSEFGSELSQSLGSVLVRRIGDNEAEVRLSGTSRAIEAPWLFDVPEGELLAYGIGADGLRNRQVSFDLSGGALRFAEAGRYVVLWGKASKKPDFRIAVDSVEPSGVWESNVGGKVTVSVSNVGLRSCGGDVKAYLGQAKKEYCVGKASLRNLASGEKRQVTLEIDTSRLAGKCRLLLVVEGDRDDLYDGDNRCEILCDVMVDLEKSRVRHMFKVYTGDVDRSLEPMSLPLDFSDLARHGAGKLLVENIHLLRRGDDGAWQTCEFYQFDPDPDFDGKKHLKGTLEFSFDAPAKTEVEFMVVARQGGKAGMKQVGSGLQVQADLGEMRYDGETYSVVFREGTLVDMMPGRRYGGGVDFLTSLVVSSQASGWSVEEEAVIERFEVLRSGPALVELVVEKTLRPGVRYEKHYLMYPGRLVVTADLDKPCGGLYSRGFYCVDGEFLHDKGKGGKMGLANQAAGLYGTNPEPKWYALRGDGWSKLCAATTDDFTNISFWDSGGASRGQIGFTSDKHRGLRYTYFIYGSEPDFSFASRDYSRAKHPARFVE